MHGPDVCRKLRARGDGAYVYTILLTGRDSKQDVVEGMNAGADDYITKPFDSHELAVRLRAGRRILDLQSALLAAQEVLREEATHDPLTGLWNRVRVFEALSLELARAARDGTSVSAIMADLDHFKAVNDSWGHMAGDAALREAARRIGSCVRLYDVVARYGGEEFLLVCPGCDEVAAAALAERIRDVIASRPVNTSEGLIPLTVSLGTATSVGGASAPEEIVRAADAALYRAKEAGRNRVEGSGRVDLTLVWPAREAEGR